MPLDLGFMALPGTGLSGWRAAASLEERVLDSFWAVVRSEVRDLLDAVRRAFSLERAASSFLRDVMSEVRDWRSVTCCFRALMTASWSGDLLAWTCHF
jgi:hypothetical protein